MSRETPGPTDSGGDDGGIGSSSHGARSAHPTVTVVIPVRDDAVMLERCLEALWLQSRRPDEIVVVDNGSTDTTCEVARWWNTVYLVETELGISAAASAGYDAATGDIIARLDADSEPPYDWTERVGAAFTDDTLGAL